MNRRRFSSPFRRRPAPRDPDGPVGADSSALPRLFWSDVIIDAARTCAVIPTPARIRLWTLVLTSRHVPHRFDSTERRMRILVPSRFFDHAIAEIVAFERENSGMEPELAPQAATGALWPAFWAMLALAFAYGLTSGGLRIGGLDHIAWEARGLADSALMLGGQWWRAVTALTLHADPAHLLSNMVLGAVFLVPLMREVGIGAGLLAALASGVLGNAFNAWFHGPGHLSLGASTAVFGAVGVLGGLRAIRGEGDGLRRVFLPVAMGLAFLAFLGAGGGRTDLGAHLFGFASGVVIGLAFGLCIGRWGLVPRGADSWLVAAAAALPVACWWLALVS